MSHHRISARATVAIIAVACLSIAQAPRTPAPRTPDETPILDRQEPPRSKSDAYRVVGKVLAVDRERGVLKLSTEEGERDVKPTAQLLQAVRVGDTVSVPRPEDEPVSASPRRK